MSPSSSSSSSTSTHSRARRRPRPSRDQLLRHLEILGDLPALLPSTLPPSPPASRSPSPERPSLSGTKRKAEQRRPSESKRQRMAGSNASSSSSPSSSSLEPPPPTAPHHPGPEALPTSSSAPQPSLPTASATAQTAATSSSSSSSFMPIKRPRRTESPSSSEMEEMHVKYLGKGRLLKYSGESRYASSHSPSHKEYRPLAVPPQPGSLYHRYAAEVARLELFDAFLYFTYALWITDERRGDCVRTSWMNSFGFWKWARDKWLGQENEAEKAFLGLFDMIASFIHARIYWYITRSQIVYDANALYKQTCAEIAKVVQAAQRADGGAQHTPPMLPSPASIGATNSANSTPSGVAPSPATSASTSTPPPPGGYARFLPPELSAQFKNAPAAADKVTVPFGPAQAQQLKNQVHSMSEAARLAQSASLTLNLAVLAKHFPNTFARVVHSGYRFSDERDPDFEDTEGELFWPTQLHNGTGIGWLCLLGKSMVNEFGKTYGYQGLAGAVPKPGAAPAGTSAAGASSSAEASRR